MKRSQRGAARVSVVWLVVFLVLALVGCLFGYMGFDAAEKSRLQAEEAKRSKDEALAASAEAHDAVTRISKAVGWSAPDASTPNTNLDTMKTEFEAFRGAFPDMGADVATLDVGLQKAAAAYKAKQAEIGTLNEALAAAKNEKTTIENSLREALRAKDTEISGLQKQLSDEQNNASQRVQELEGRIASLNNQRNDLDAQLRDTRNTVEASSRKHEEEKQAWETRMKASTKPLAFLAEPESPDGRVISVSNDLGIGFINIGASNRLSRGMRFRVVSGQPNSKSLKGWAEVTDVKPTMAEVRFYDVTDRFDPIVRDDVIFNPVYDPKGERTAVLVGRFSGQFNESELKTLLSNMNIRVQDRLAIDTDYLIVGAELYTDENGQPLENPMPPQELAIYKNAEAQGTQIVSIKQLRDYFKF